MGNPQIAQVPGEVGAELVAVVSLDPLNLDPLNGHREPLAKLVEKGDRIRNRAVSVDPEDAIAGGLVHRRELIGAAAAQLEVFDVNLDGLSGHGELSAAARSRPVSLHRDSGYPMPPTCLADVVGDLLVMLNLPKSGLRLSQLLQLGGRFPHERLPRSGSEAVQGKD